MLTTADHVPLNNALARTNSVRIDRKWLLMEILTFWVLESFGVVGLILVILVASVSQTIYMKLYQ